MLSYELCKKLKDTGFPQKISTNSGNTHYEIDCPNEILICGISQPEPIRENKYLKIPTLSELIEACGKRFKSIEQIQDYWQATCYVTNSFNTLQLTSTENIGEGKTPEEAVANLWLTLDKKKV